MKLRPIRTRREHQAALKKAEALNRVRPLTLDVIRRLAAGLKIPTDVLVRGYKLKRAA